MDSVLNRIAEAVVLVLTLSACGDDKVPNRNPR
jgi:hypothetical protein